MQSVSDENVQEGSPGKRYPVEQYLYNTGTGVEWGCNVRFQTIIGSMIGE